MSHFNKLWASPYISTYNFSAFLQTPCTARFTHVRPTSAHSSSPSLSDTYAYFLHSCTNILVLSRTGSFMTIGQPHTHYTFLFHPPLKLNIYPALRMGGGGGGGGACPDLPAIYDTLHTVQYVDFLCPRVSPKISKFVKVGTFFSSHLTLYVLNILIYYESVLHQQSAHSSSPSLHDTLAYFAGCKF
jgi:hypothetical protein